MGKSVRHLSMAAISVSGEERVVALIESIRRVVLTVGKNTQFPELCELFLRKGEIGKIFLCQPVFLSEGIGHMEKRAGGGQYGLDSGSL